MDDQMLSIGNSEPENPMWRRGEGVSQKGIELIGNRGKSIDNCTHYGEKLRLSGLGGRAKELRK